MTTKPTLTIENHTEERVVSFPVDCHGPEEAAWNLLRDWAVANLDNYTQRRYIGCAPKGHHPKGEEHQPNEPIDSHEYLAQMFLSEREGDSETFLGADVRNAPDGLYLVGDVEMSERNNDGTIDIGASMMKSFGVMSEYLKDTGGYEFQLQERPYFEEHVFSNEWFNGHGDLAGFRLWLPIRKL